MQHVPAELLEGNFLLQIHHLSNNERANKRARQKSGRGWGGKRIYIIITRYSANTILYELILPVILV